MLSVDVSITDVVTQEVVRNTLEVDVPFEIEVLLSSTHPLTKDHEKEIDDYIFTALKPYIETFRGKIGEFFELDYEVLPRTLN